MRIVEEIGRECFGFHLGIMGEVIMDPLTLGVPTINIVPPQEPHEDPRPSQAVSDPPETVGMEVNPGRKPRFQLIAKNILRMGHGAQKVTQKFQKKMTESSIIHPFDNKTIIQCVMAIVFYILDYGSDITVAYYLAIEEDTAWWFSLTVVLIVLPLVIINIFSIVWFHQDHQDFHQYPHVPKHEKAILVLFHLVLLGPVIRQLHIIRMGLMEKKLVDVQNDKNANIHGPFCIDPNKYELRPVERIYMNRKSRERDSAYLGLIDAFIQDGPQLILQIYILGVRHTEDLDETSTAVWQIVAIFVSLLTLSQAMLAFESANRMANHEQANLNPMSSVMYLSWRFFMVASRVFTLALFATQFKSELFIFIGLHYLLMVFWIIMTGTEFCGSAEGREYPVGEFIYNLVIGWVFVFDIVHIKEGPTRLKQAAYYVLSFAETSVLIGVWYSEVHRKTQDVPTNAWYLQQWFQITTLTLIPCFFVLALISMALYYRKFHPNGVMPDVSQKGSLL